MELTERCHCHYSSEISNGRSAFLLLIRVILALIFCCPRYHMVAYWHFNVGLEFFTSLSDSSCDDTDEVLSETERVFNKDDVDERSDPMASRRTCALARSRT